MSMFKVEALLVPILLCDNIEYQVFVVVIKGCMF